ncbi:MAG: GNAT family N-acetyltransferase [Myxococcales bacterium]|nr:GNAT family N-acetyltransferase [Myxococcales bacterium]MCB9577613.1 GNAT family N-acetyltransferase [Polyangiaceae bacterium]
MKAIHSASESEARRWLSEARAVHVAGTTPEGAPLLRALHTAWVDDAFTFHGSVRGEKTLWDGRPVVIATERVVARIPSYFRDPERACPATTYYLSAQVEGVVERVVDPDAKARALAALMARHQPEGGHVPIAADHPLYRSSIDSLWVMRVVPTRVSGKKKLGQERPVREIENIVRGLWQRGTTEDLRAIDVILDAHPEGPRPDFLVGPDGTRLCPALGPQDVSAGVELLRDQYWNVGVDDARLAAALVGSSAWVGARNADGRLVATARAISDGAKRAEILDVAVAEPWRGRGVGRRVFELLLSHAAVRSVRSVNLRTKDAQSFYARFEFTSARPRNHEMALVRA